MSTINKISFLASVCPPLDRKLTEQLLDEFISLEQRFVLHDWEPATLDGGQFTEAAARILYHQDSRNLNYRKPVNKCIEYIENDSNPHHYPERQSAIHTAKVIRTVYKFRSARGAIHISPDYTANHLDSKLVLENTRWILAEIMRIFWSGDRLKVVETIRQLVKYDVPVIGDFGGKLLVQRTDCTAEEEILILLYHAGEMGLSRIEIGKAVPRNPSTVTRTLNTICSSANRKAVKRPKGNYCLTSIGTRYVLTELSERLISM